MIPTYKCFIKDKLIPLIISCGVAVILMSPLPYGNVETWSVSLIEIIAFITFGIWAIGEILKGRIRILPSPIYVPVGLFFIIILLQTVELPGVILAILSPHKAELFQNKGAALEHLFGSGITLSNALSLYPFLTKEKLHLYLSYAAFFLIVSNYIKTSSQIKRFFWIVFTLSIVESLIGLLQYIVSGTNVPASGTYINPNHFAGLLIVVVPLFLGYVLYLGDSKTDGTGTRENKKKAQLPTQLILLFATSLMAISLILAQSRGAIFSFAVSILIFYILISRYKKSGSIKLLLSIFFVIVILYSIWIGLDPVIEKFSKTTKELPNRTYIWKDSLKLITDFPILGTGLGTFSLAYALYKKEAFWPYIYDHAHNDYIELAAETGLAGLILIIWALAAFFKTEISNGRNFSPKRDPLRYYLFLGCLSGMAGMLIHAITEFDFQIPANTYYFIFLLGLSTSMSHIMIGRKK